MSNTTRTTHMASDSPPRRLSLTCRNTTGRQSFETVRAKIQRRSALGVSFDPTFMRLPKLWSFGASIMTILSRQPQRLTCCSCRRLSCAIGSCRISPLNTQTFTPQAPWCATGSSAVITSARSVCRGTRPSRYHSVRAISAPPSRPALVYEYPVLQDA